MSLLSDPEVENVNRLPIVPTLLEVIGKTTGMGFVAIAKVTATKWIACSVRDEVQFGLKPGGELKLETTICHEIHQNEAHTPVVIDNVAEDKLYSCHQTPAMYGFQSYISVPILRRDGSFFGTLCAINPHPAKLNNPETIGMFMLYADLLSFHMYSFEQLYETESRLKEEQEAANLRNMFIAVLGHDLKNPLGAISASSELLLSMPVNDSVLKLGKIIKNSAFRMNGLITNILDFARQQLGEGIVLNTQQEESLENTLTHIVSELKAVWQNRVIEMHVSLQDPVVCDSSKIAQLFSNLLANALSYSKPDTPVYVKAISVQDSFTLSVSNKGNKISQKIIDRLFQPFFRGEAMGNQQGLGLGLYIAFEIANAHNGKISVTSNDDKTTFTFSMPSR